MPESLGRQGVSSILEFHMERSLVQSLKSMLGKPEFYTRVSKEALKNTQENKKSPKAN